MPICAPCRVPHSVDDCEDAITGRAGLARRCYCQHKQHQAVATEPSPGPEPEIPQSRHRSRCPGDAAGYDHARTGWRAAVDADDDDTAVMVTDLSTAPELQAADLYTLGAALDELTSTLAYASDCRRGWASRAARCLRQGGPRPTAPPVTWSNSLSFVALGWTPTTCWAASTPDCSATPAAGQAWALTRRCSSLTWPA